MDCGGRNRKSLPRNAVMHRDFNTCGKAGLFDPWKAAGSVAGTGLKYHTGHCPDKVQTPFSRARIDSPGPPSLHSVFCPVEASLKGRSFRRPGDNHEAHVPAEQPQAEEDPRVPGPHADQGGPPRAEAAPAEGPQADRGIAPAAGPESEGFRRSERLRSGAEFQRVLRKGLRLDGPLFALIAADNERGNGRLGLAASRRLGGAVARNRAKRLLRESFRRHKLPGMDLVLIPKPEILDHTQAEVEREYRDRLRRLAARRATRPRGPAPPAGR